MRPPIWDLFLSISCTFYLKTGCAPPHLRQNSAPPFGKSWIRHCKLRTKFLSFAHVSKITLAELLGFKICMKINWTESDKTGFMSIAVADPTDQTFLNFMQILGKSGKFVCWRPAKGWYPLLRPPLPHMPPWTEWQTLVKTLSFRNDWGSNSRTSQPAIMTIMLAYQLWVGDTEKFSVTFSHAWLILVEFT